MWVKIRHPKEIQPSVELGLVQLEPTRPKSGFCFAYIADRFSHFSENMFWAYDYLMCVRFAHSSKMDFMTSFAFWRYSGKSPKGLA